MWDLLTEHHSLIGRTKVTSSRFRCQANGLEVVFVCIPQTTLYNASIVVPTFAFDNKGLAHTLEHLIFCGSERHPNKGYLDLLANNCFSNGTNAYTAEDHTCYTFNTCCLAGLERTLPTFLEHVLHPTLGKDHFYTEVCHLSKEGQFGGVVFCEMKSREHSEADLCEQTLKSMLYGSQSPYAQECGGKTKDIAGIDLEEIVAFHSKFYTASNITVLLVGNFEDPHSTLDLIGTHFDATKQVPVKRDVDFDLKSDVSTECRLVPFPATDESVGSVSFGWRGPDIMAVDEINVLDLIFKFWNENPTSLLQKTFVELENPLASSVDHEIYSFSPTSISIYFSGVPNSNETFTQIESKLSRIVAGFDANFDLHEFKSFLDRMAQKLCFSFENSPIDFATQLIIPQILVSSYKPNSHLTVGSNFDLLVFIETLKLKDVAYFVEIFDKYFKHGHCLVKMVPNIAMNEAIQSEYDNVLKAYQKRFSRDMLEEMHQLIIPSDVKVNLSEQDILINVVSQHQFISRSIPSVYLQKESFGTVQIVPIESQFFQLTLCIPLKGLDFNSKKCLLLFQELFFQSNLIVKQPLKDAFTEQHYEHEQVTKCLNEKLISFSATIGMENEVFSCGYLSDYFVLNASCAQGNITTLIGMLLQLLVGIEFAPTKIVSIAHNLSSDLAEVKREPEEVLDFLTSRLLNESSIVAFDGKSRKRPLDADNLPDSCFHSNEPFLGLFCQEKILKAASKDVKSSIEVLNLIKSTVVKNCAEPGCLLQLGIPVGMASISVVDDFMSKWSLFFAPPVVPNFRMTLPNFTRESVEIVYTMKSATTSFLVQILPIVLGFEEIKRNPVEYYSLALLCQFLSATEGPLYSRIRGDGLAYRVGLSVAIFNQQIIFSIGDSIDPFACLKVFHSLLQDIIQSPSAWINNSSLSTAKSSLIYQIQENRNTPSGILNDRFKDLLSDDAFQSNYKTILSDVQPAHLIGTLEKYFKPFLQRAGTFTAVVGPETLASLSTETTVINSLKQFYF